MSSFLSKNVILVHSVLSIRYAVKLFYFLTAKIFYLECSWVTPHSFQNLCGNSITQILFNFIPIRNRSLQYTGRSLDIWLKNQGNSQYGMFKFFFTQCMKCSDNAPIKYCSPTKKKSSFRKKKLFKTNSLKRYSVSSPKVVRDYLHLTVNLFTYFFIMIVLDFMHPPVNV